MNRFSADMPFDEFAAQCAEKCRQNMRTEAEQFIAMTGAEILGDPTALFVGNIIDDTFGNLTDLIDYSQDAQKMGVESAADFERWANTNTEAN